MAQWLDPKAPMLVRSLKRAGYTAGHFGKWHMGGQRDVAEAPPITDYGFDQSLTSFEGMGPKLLPLTMQPGNDGQVARGRIWADAAQLGGPFTWMQRSRITGGFIDAALRFIEEAKAADKPFYINVWPDDVHSPFYPPIEKWRENKRELYLAVRHQQWKLLCDFDGSRPQLYDLSADVGETKNLAEAQPEVTNRLTKQVTQWHKSLLRSK